MTIQGVGVGFRKEISDEILHEEGFRPRFVEFAPENWMAIGGRWARVLREVAERYPILSHGLSLSLGSPEPLDWDFLKQIKAFFQQVPVQLYSEHLSYSKCQNAHLYDLLPIPFREDAVRHVAARIREVQDFLERPIAIENVSYYSPVAPEMDEATFVRSVVEEADCLLLLDINNVYVNSVNHGYDPKAFLQGLPLDRVAYIHMAGHHQESENFVIDTHGASVSDPVFELLEWALRSIQPVPILLERDFNFPPYGELQEEMMRLQEIANRAWSLADATP